MENIKVSEGALLVFGCEYKQPLLFHLGITTGVVYSCLPSPDRLCYLWMEIGDHSYHVPCLLILVWLAIWFALNMLLSSVSLFMLNALNIGF